MPGSSADPWWKSAIIYQIYPRSFQDSNGDGVGDLPGIVRRLDHIAELGADAIWLSPFYVSPMVDFGYDIADHCAVDPVFGTMADFDRLLAEARKRGLRLILDFVPNHTSDRHPWFLESRSSRNSRRRDWYIWKDPAPDGGPPNDWVDATGGSAWEWDEDTAQFYYHRFLKEQPDLNWRHSEVLEAMRQVLRFWLERGVDGFRVDAATSLVEDALLREDPVIPQGGPGTPTLVLRRVFTRDRPETHQVIAAFRAALGDHPDAVLIGEAHLPLARVMEYYGEGRGFNLPFNFELLNTPWGARSVEAAIDQYTMLLPSSAWPNWVLGNHDENRVASRVGEGQARVAAMLSLTLKGTPFIYNGEELGLQNVRMRSDQLRDVMGLRGGKGRDPQRAPMPWDESPQAGFTTGSPWLPLGPDARERSVSAQQADPRSMLQLYRRLIAMRRREPALAIGDYQPFAEQGSVLAYRRMGAGKHFHLALNFGAGPATARLPEGGRILLSTHLDREEEVTEQIELRPDEGVVVELRA